MKNFIFILAALFLSFALQAGTGTPNDLILLATGPKELVLKIDEPLSMTTRLQILDEAGNVLFTDQLAANFKVAKHFKFEQLTEGDYQLVLTDELFESAYAFSMISGRITVNKNNVQVSALPVVNVQNNMAYLNFINSEKLKVTVKIIDQHGNTVYIDKIPGRDVVMRTYNLTELEESDYQMVVTAGPKSITKYLAL